MADFSKLSKLKVDETTTAKYIFYDLPGEPWIKCKPATKQNKSYFSEVLKNPLMQKIASGRKISDSDSKDADKLIIGIYADHIIVDWGDMQDLTDDTRCTKQNKKDFIASLIENAEWVWDKFANWAQDPKSFLQIDTDTKEKN